MGLRDQFQGWRLVRRVESGKQPWGRQEVATEVPGTISARVHRASTDTWEDIGVIAEKVKE